MCVVEADPPRALQDQGQFRDSETVDCGFDPSWLKILLK
jgi:hypothetical protein